MNYYIQGSPARAKEIKAAFEKLGYNTGNLGFTSDQLYYTVEGKVELMLMCTKSLQNLIKTHPDYKELELPVEPNFKVGDWIVCWNRTYQIIDNKFTYIVREINSLETRYEHSTVDENGRLWSIQDARDGDVITNGKLIVIFNKFEEPAYKQHIIAYAGLDLCGKLQITEDTWQLGIDKAMPATKEQRNMLFAKMKEAGYTWDAEKKELRKIKPHYDIKNFKPFDKVLVRCSNDEEWMIEFYCKYDTLVHTSPHRDYPFMGIGDSYSQCIPFEGNEHLLGTTEMCDERYINW